MIWDLISVCNCDSIGHNVTRPISMSQGNKTNLYVTMSARPISTRSVLARSISMRSVLARPISTRLVAVLMKIIIRVKISTQFINIRLCLLPNFLSPVRCLSDKIYRVYQTQLYRSYYSLQFYLKEAITSFFIDH